MKKRRVDELLIEQHLVEDKQEALSYILAGKVFTTDEIKILTAGEKLAQDIELYIKGKEKKYVSRGGLKLEKAIEYFNIDLANQIVLDIGASTGGFTDVSLKNLCFSLSLSHLTSLRSVHIVLATAHHSLR